MEIVATARHIGDKMNSWAFWLTPILSFLFLVAFVSIHWCWYARLHKYREGTKEHSERIYRDFEFFVKIFMALVAAVGYLRLKEFSASPELTRQGMKAVGYMGFFTMNTLAIFVICHQGSKIRRWRIVEWKTIFFWQEIWMLIAMFGMATGLWYFAWTW